MNRYTQPEYQVGAQFLNVQLPNVNSLTQGITSDQPGTLHGTDPASFAKDALFGYQEQTAMVPGLSGGVPTSDTLGEIGRGVVFSAIGLLILAFGLWVMVKQ